KLTGRAYSVINGEDCETVERLCSFLEKAFAPRKDIDDMRGERAEIYMKKGEHILDYRPRQRITMRDT
ncbi:unnamed protein product, partial [Heterotrigona itama]